jgi:hypothetical protein
MALRLNWKIKFQSMFLINKVANDWKLKLTRQ